MTVTRWPHAIQRETWPNRFVPVPPPWGCVQSRSVSSRMWSGRSIGRSYPTAASPTLARVFAPRRLLAVLATAALAAPTAAHAQGAGDDQYQDPFGAPKTTKAPPAASNQRAQAGQPSLSNQPPAQAAPAQTQRAAPSSAAPAQPQRPAPSSAAPAQAAPAAGTPLPYTGAEIPAMALMGLGLLAVGIGLRLRTVDDTLF